MEQKIIKVGLPAGHESYSDEALTEWDWKYLNTGVSVFAYWYGCGCYEGTGNAIYKAADGKWNLRNLGHCSCYGPMGDGEEIGANGIYETLEDLISKLSEELKKECQGIIDALEENQCK